MKQNSHNIFRLSGLFILAFVFGFKLNAQDIKPLPQLHKDFQVVVHLVQNDSGQVGIGQQKVLEVMNGVNALFSPIEVNFTVCEFREILNFQHDTIGDYSRGEVIVKYGLRKRINIFVFEQIIDKEAAIDVAGNADLGGIAKDVEGKYGVFIENKQFSIETVSHEMGHFFGLEHTFSKDNGGELVDGSNCATTGDLICDTPADPFVPGADQADFIKQQGEYCVFTDKEKDANGAYYSPMVNNVMSYYSCTPVAFTRGQYIRMIETYRSNPLNW